jgi:hypothetical protein
MEETLQRVHLDTLREQLGRCRAERARLFSEISSSSISADRKHEAMIRYSLVVERLRKLGHELERFGRGR